MCLIINYFYKSEYRVICMRTSLIFYLAKIRLIQFNYIFVGIYIMKFCTQVFLLLSAITLGLVYKQYNSLSAPKPIPKLDIDAYWGPGTRTNKDNTEIIKQEIRHSDVDIKKLRKKLNETLYVHSPLENIGYEYGVNTDSLLEFVKFWRDDYLPKWNERQAYLNSFPHFITEIQG